MLQFSKPLTRLFITLTLILAGSLSHSLFSQNALPNWDVNYALVDAEKVITYEIEYAKKIEADTSETQYYLALNKYRFVAAYTGNKRDLKKDVLTSIQNVLRVRMGDPNIVNDLISKELEFKVGQYTIWMPIQTKLIRAFEEEVEVGGQVLLYTLFTNEHKYEGGGL